MVAAGTRPAVTPAILLALPFALIGCGEASMEPRFGQDRPEPRFGKEKFTYCKPHVNVNSGSSAPTGGPTTIAVVQPQVVAVQLEDDSRVPGDFAGQLLVWENGAACGEASLEIDEGAGLAVAFGFSEANVSRDGAGNRLVAFRGTARLCPGDGQDCRSEEMAGTVVEQPDDPVWQFHGPGAYSFPAGTRFVTPGVPTRGSVSGHFPAQTVELKERGRTATVRFEADFVVGPDGSANGIMILDISDIDNPETYDIDAGRFVMTRAGAVLVWLHGLRRQATTGEATRFAATVSRLSADDDPIWQFHSGDAHRGRFEAAGQLTVLE